MEVLNDIKLQVKNVTFSYGQTQILKDVSLSVETGSFVSILGHSGCGKTTLLRLICGLLTADNGDILLDNICITKLLPKKRNVGIIFQDAALFNNMTAIKNIEYVLKGRAEFKHSFKERAIEALDQIEMLEHKDKYPEQLSFGQQQRVAIARSMALKPHILLLDEPLSALDADARFSLRGELKKIQKQTNMTMLYVTHDQEEALTLSDKVAIIHEGEVQQIDTPHNIINNPSNKFVSDFVANNIKMKYEALSRLITKGFQ